MTGPVVGANPCSARLNRIRSEGTPMHHRTPQSRSPIVPRPVHVQPLEGRRLMSVAPPMDPPMAFAPLGDVVVPAGPIHPGFELRIAMDHAAATVEAETAPVLPDALVSVAPSVAPTVAATGTPLAAVPLSGDASIVTTTALPAVALPADWAQPAEFATGGTALAPMPAAAVPTVSTALGDIVPTVGRTPFTADDVTPAPVPANVAMAMASDATAPALVDATAVTPDASIVGPAASVAVPSFGETVIESAEASHPLAIALAAAGATALWVSTESARDRRREQLCRAIASAVHDGQMVAFGLFRA